MIKNIKTLSLLDILPDNLLADKQIYAAAKAVDYELQLVTEACKETMHLPRLDELPEPVIDLLAWQWHVDFYEADMDLPTKRRMVKQSIAWHRRKGTPSAVREVATAVFGNADVSEWFDYDGQPYHFKINLLDAPGITQEKIDTIVRLVDTVKNTRSVLDNLGVKRRSAATVHMGAATMIHKKYHVGPAQIRDTDINGNTYEGVIPHIHKRYKVSPATIHNASITVRPYTGGGAHIHKRYKV